MSLNIDEIPVPSRTIAGTRPALEVRLARTSAEVEAALRLRYQVFYQELGASALEDIAVADIDRDRFDAFCDHLLVIDTGLEVENSVVGTYRLLPGSRSDQAGGFYSASEFDLTPLLTNGPPAARLLECGRSCISKGYRSSQTIQLLWRGIAAYMSEHNIEAMFGCASLPGTNIKSLASQLGFLQRHALAPAPLRVAALAKHRVNIDPVGTRTSGDHLAWKALPPLIKAYLRLGARVGEGAVIDRQFGTTDVFILLPTQSIPLRYHRHFDR